MGGEVLEIELVPTRRQHALDAGPLGGEGLRKKVLDALFGAEEEFEYTSTTTSAPSPQTAGTTT